MVESKGWEWTRAAQETWLKPADEVYYLSSAWREQGFRRVLDLGSGLGRHAVFFARAGFEVAALDISEYAVDRLRLWALSEGLTIDIRQGDMLSLPYEAGAFDAVFAYHTISHTDSVGIKKVLSELERVLRPGGALFATMCAKDAYEFREAGFPRVDESTALLCTAEGPEQDVPHFFADREDIMRLFNGFELERVRHIDYCVLGGEKQDLKHYYINAKRLDGKKETETR